MESPFRAPGDGSALSGLLARLGAPSLPPSRSLAAHLTGWIDWRHAVSLSSALDVRPATDGVACAAAVEDRAEGERLRAALARAVDTDRLFAADRSDAPDTAQVRQRYLVLQQTLGADVGLLRRRVRERLRRQPGPAARLAAVDAALENALAARERTTLASLADTLAAHFERLRERHAGQPPHAWLHAFRDDMRGLLLAELDFRLQPVNALLAAFPHTPDDSDAPQAA